MANLIKFLWNINSGQRYFCAAIVFVVLFAAPVWLQYAWHCHSNYDFGIYAQAVQYLGTKGFNPQLTVYPFLKFNDHFDPIIFVTLLLRPFLDNGYNLLFWETLFVCLSILPVYWLQKEKLLDPGIAWFGALYILFNRGTISGVFYPVHPTVWSMFALSLCCYFLAVGKKTPLYLSLLFLMLFREEYPISVVCLSFYYFFKRDYKFGTLLFLSGTLWLIYFFGIHPKLFPGYNARHGQDLLQAVFSNPFIVLKQFTDYGLMKRIFQVCIPLFPLVWILKKEKLPWNWPVFLLLLPLLGTRFASSRWAFHYMAPVSVLLFWLFAGQTGGKSTWYVIPKKAIVISLLMLVGFNTSNLKKSFLTYSGRTYGNSCNPDKERLQSISQAYDYLKQNSTGTVAAMATLVPTLSWRDQLYQMGDPYLTEGKHDGPGSLGFQFLLTEKKAGSPFPYSFDQLNICLDYWRKHPNLKIIKDDEFVFLAQAQSPASGENFHQCFPRPSS